MCNRIGFKCFADYAIIAAAICVILCCCAKKPPKVYRVGIVSGAEAFAEIADGFKTKMTELGYIEGRNIIYDLQKLNDGPEKEQQAVNKFVSDKVDLIFAFPSGPAFKAKAAVKGTGIPVVFALAGIEGNNLVESIAMPGDNITGIRFPGPEITAKRLEILHELVPQAKRIYLVYDPNYPTASSAVDSLHELATLLGITLIEDTVGNIEELKTALRMRGERKDIGMDAIFIMPEILTQSSEGWAVVIKFANKHKLPVSGGTVYTVQNGALFSVTPNNIKMGESSAFLVDKIFKGTPAGSIMVVTPAPYILLNYKKIKEFELTASEDLLNSADEIIR